MGRLLKLALEGEQIEVAEGMFVAVPIGAVEDVRAISTEAFADTIKNAAKKVWEHLAKLLAAIAASITGVTKWLLTRLKGDKGRKVNQEIVHQYEVLEESIRNFKSADPESKMESIARTDHLSEEASRTLSSTAHALLDESKAYLGAVGEVEKMLDASGQAAIVKASSLLVALSKLGLSHPLNNHDADGVGKQIAVVHEQFEHLPEKLTLIQELIASAYKEKTDERLPANPTQLASVLATAREALSGTSTVETFERWSKEVALIEKDINLATRQTQAHLSVAKDEQGQDVARAMLAGYASFWRELQPVLKALAMLDQLRSGALQLTETVIRYWREVVKRTMDEYKGQEAVLNRIVELDRVFQTETQKLKQLVGM